MSERAIVSLRPDVMLYDADDYHWRPAKLTEINGASATVRVFVASGFIRNKIVAAADLPSTSIGAPFNARISNTNPDTCIVLEMVGASWSRASAPADNAAAALDDGVWPVINRSITDAPATWWKEDWSIA
jgi:hypothetical protein